MAYVIPPDNRAVGTGNPPADMNDVSDVLTGFGAGWSILNTAFAGGADPTGAADSAPAINAALAAAPAGQVITCPVGKYLLKSPLVIGGGVTAEGVGLAGYHGATMSGNDASSDLGTVFAVSASFTNPTWSSQATGAILLLDSAPGSGTAYYGPRLRDFWVDGTSGPASVDGISVYGNVNSVLIERVGLSNMTGNGVGLYVDGSTQPDGLSMNTIVAQNCAGYGFIGKFVDTTAVNCHAQSSASDGFKITGANNRWIACRGDLNTNGFTFDVVPGGGFMDSNILIGCGSQRNQHNGLNVINGSAAGTGLRSPVIVSGCIWSEDGVNGGSGGGGFAGMKVSGANTVIIDNTTVTTGTVDVAGGCPQYALATASSGTTPGVPASVRWNSGLANAVTGAVNDAAPSTDLYIGPAVNQSIGAGLYAGVVVQPFLANESLLSATVKASTNSLGGLLAITQSQSAPTNPGILYIGQAAADGALAHRVSGDSQSRLRTNFDGKMSWGSGSATADVVLARGAAGRLDVSTSAGSTFEPVGVNTMGDLFLAPSGAFGQTMTRRSVTATNLTTSSGQVYLTAVYLPAGVTITHIEMATGLSNAKTGGTHGWYVLTDSGLVVRDATADQTDPATVWGTLSTPYKIATTAGYLTTYSGLYYVGMMVATSAGTQPNFAGSGSIVGGLNGDVPVLAGLSSVGQTTPPATNGSVTLTSISANALYQMYACVS